MKKIETGTQLLGLLSVSTYGGICDSDRVIDNWTIDNDFNEGYVPYDANMFWENFDNKAYKEDIIKVASNYILNYMLPEIKKLNLGIKKIDIVKIHSPQYYNFETDHLYFDLIVNNNFHKNLLKIINNLTIEEKTNLDNWLRENFSSRSGFSSFTANNLGDLISEIKSEETRETSVFLEWYFLNKGSDDLQDYMNSDNWEEYFLNNVNQYSEFVSNEFLKECELGDKFSIEYTHSNYVNKSAETIINELKEILTEKHENDFNDNLESRIEWMEKTVNNVFKTIAKQTLDLFAE